MTQPAMHALSAQIRDEIHAHGTLSFARFMELALYAPELGYYEQRRPIGRAGDFLTSVSVGAVFGQLLAWQFAAWLRELPESLHPLRMVEGGAHEGRLAADLLANLRQFEPALLDRLEYWILEPSEKRRGWQHQSLIEFLPIVRWAPNWESLAQEVQRSHTPLSGIIFANELLDAFPVHRLFWNALAQAWQEQGVQWRNNQFVWEWRPLDAPLVSCTLAPPELLQQLPHGFAIAIAPSASQWWQKAAMLLHQGRLLTLDYGLTMAEWFSPERTGDTVRAYRDHRLCADLLAAPGEQDLTAHIHFDALQQAGQQAGLQTESFIHQGRFLAQIGTSLLADPARAAEWQAHQIRQFQTLTHPNHLGAAFRVLVQRC